MIWYFLTITALIYRKNPPIRHVSTKGAKLQQTLQSFSRVSTQSFSRDSVQSSSFSRDSALGVRRGGSAGVGGRGRGGGTFGYVGLRWVTLGYLRLRWVTFGYLWDPLFLDFIFGPNFKCSLPTLWAPILLKNLENSGTRAACRELTKMVRQKMWFWSASNLETKPACWREHDFMVLTLSRKN